MKAMIEALWVLLYAFQFIIIVIIIFLTHNRHNIKHFYVHCELDKSEKQIQEPKV